MYYIYLDYIIDETIIFDKIGISIRPLSNDEKNKLMDNINYILKYKTDMMKLVKKYNFEESNFEQIYELAKSKDKDPNGIIMMGYYALKDNFKFNSIRTINKIVNHMVVIDVDKEKITKYVDEKYISKFVSNFLNLGIIYDKAVNTNEIRRNIDYTYILDNNIFEDNEEFYHQILLTIVMSYNGKDVPKKIVVRNVDISDNYLSEIKKFEKKLDNEELIKFFEILDLLYSHPSMIQNAILNNVLIVESLIINEKANIEKDYILKGGMILKEYLNLNSKISNERIRTFLKFVYDIRSDIIHGNNKKIQTDLNTLNQKIKGVKKLIGTINTYKETKDSAFSVAYTLSYYVTLSVIKYWINNPTGVNYLKNN